MEGGEIRDVIDANAAGAVGGVEEGRALRVEIEPVEV